MQAGETMYWVQVQARLLQQNQTSSILKTTQVSEYCDEQSFGISYVLGFSRRVGRRGLLG